MRRLAVVTLLAACGTGPRPPIGNTGEPDSELAVAVDQSMGRLAIATARPGGTTSWLPVTDAPLTFLLAPADGLATGAPVPLVPADGSSGATLIAGAPATTPYGCDNNQLEIIPLSGAAVAPGLAWVPPAPLPDRWRPAAIRVEPVRAEPGRAGWTAGPIALDLERDAAAPTRGMLRYTLDGKEVARRAVEKSFMEGADEGPIDLTGAVPGLPAPLAAFALGPAGPWLVVHLVTGYEGFSLTTALVGAGGVRDLELTGYLYACAF